MISLFAVQSRLARRLGVVISMLLAMAKFDFRMKVDRRVFVLLIA